MEAMFGHNVLDIDMAKKGNKDDLRDKLTVTRNRERWEPFLQFYKSKKMEVEDVAAWDIEDNVDLLEVLFSCSLNGWRWRLLEQRGRRKKEILKPSG